MNAQKRKKLVVLGSSGFIGRHFLSHAAAGGYDAQFEIVGIDKVDIPVPGVRLMVADLSDRNSLERILVTEQPEYIVNLAGIFQGDDMDRIIAVNATLSKHLMDIVLLRKIPVTNILLIGSAAEYGMNASLPIRECDRLDPVTPYGISKALQSHYARYYNINHGVPLNIARTFNIIGKYISPSLSIGSFVKQIKDARAHDSIHVGNLNAKRDYLDIVDVVAAFWKILLNGRNGNIYNVCSGRSILMRDIVEQLITLSGKEIDIIVEQKWIRQNDIADIYGDNGLLKNHTDWSEKSTVSAALKKALE